MTEQSGGCDLVPASRCVSFALKQTYDKRPFIISYFWYDFTALLSVMCFLFLPCVTWSLLNLFYFLHIIYIEFHNKSIERTKTSIIHYSVDSCQRKDRKVRSGEGRSVGRKEMLPVESKLVSHVRWVTHSAKSFLFFLQKDTILYLLNIVIFKGGL